MTRPSAPPDIAKMEGREKKEHKEMERAERGRRQGEEDERVLRIVGGKASSACAGGRRRDGKT